MFIGHAGSDRSAFYRATSAGLSSNSLLLACVSIEGGACVRHCPYPALCRLNALLLELERTINVTFTFTWVVVIS